MPPPPAAEPPQPFSYEYKDPAADAERAAFAEAFQAADRNGDGVLDRNEFGPHPAAASNAASSKTADRFLLFPAFDASPVHAASSRAQSSSPIARFFCHCKIAKFHCNNLWLWAALQ